MSEPSKGRTNTYEGMFLMTQGDAADLDAATGHIRHLFDRANADVIALRKWDERRLAYEIDHNKRGTYFLSYFSCDPANIDGLSRDCNLSETIVRAMFLRADHLTRDQMEAADASQQMADEAALRGDGAEATEAASAEG
jgi:small subunit ribosomal protein S6